jgi:hypothetical protein
LQQSQAGQIDSNYADLPAVIAAADSRKRFRILRTAVATTAPAGIHTEPVTLALASEQILHANALATITTNFIVVRRPEARAETMIGLLRISKIRHIETTHPGLLVIASSLYLLAAAAGCSKQGDQAGLPFAALGTLFVIAYFTTRRAAVAFVVDREATETARGSVSEAAALVKTMLKALPALRKAQ